jgi:single-strand selective monofunctional uracil DNA glycosylase
MDLVSISRSLAKRVDGFEFSEPVAHWYNPLTYAARAHEAYLRKYGQAPKEVLLVGMNPGPFGMAQTGVPFGDVRMVQEWLRICEPIEKPPLEHPRRPILGFNCARSEVSGTRLWGWAKSRFGTPALFFKQFFIWNYCPLCFMGKSGANITPDKLARAEREQLLLVCDGGLAQVVAVLAPRFVVGIGGFAEKRIRAAVRDEGVIIGSILHPSPASPAANKNWVKNIESSLRDLGVKLRT